MGFASFFESLSNAYSGIKSTIGNLYHKGKEVVHGVRQGFNWFDEKLNQLSSIPFLNTIISEGKSLLQYDLIRNTIADIDNIAQSGELEAYGGMVDQLISGGLQAGQQIGGAIDTYFGGGGSPPNSTTAGQTPVGRQTMTAS